MDPTQNASQLSSPAIDPSMLGGPAPTSAATPPTFQTPQNQPAAPAPNPAAVAKVSRLAGLGHMVEQLFTGKETQYSVDPATGKTVATQVPESPGSIFRHVLAGAILGGAASNAHPNPSAGFLGGVATGANAAMRQNEAGDAQRREQAQQEFANEQRVQQANREQKESDARIAESDAARQKNLADIAYYNAMTLHENKMMQGEDLKQHQETADQGKAQLEPFLAAGIEPIFKDVDETDIPKIYASNPDAKNYLWEPTGTKIVIGQDGTPNHILTYSAIDPKGEVTVTPRMMKQWKDAGLDKSNPDLFGAMRAGIKVPAATMVSMQGKYQMEYNRQLQQKKDKLATDKDQAEINRANAEASHYSREAANERLEKKNAQIFNDALDELNKVGGDFTKLSPKSKVVIAESGNKLISSLNSAIESAVNSLDPDAQDTAHELMAQREQILKLTSQAFSGIGSGTPTTKPSKVQRKAPTTPVPAGKAIIYDPKGEPHAVDAALVDRYLADPAYKGWSK